MSANRQGESGADTILSAVRDVIELAESWPAPQPPASRGRVRALALLWAAYDEIASLSLVPHAEQPIRDAKS